MQGSGLLLWLLHADPFRGPMSLLLSGSLPYPHWRAQVSLAPSQAPAGPPARVCCLLLIQTLTTHKSTDFYGQLFQDLGEVMLPLGTSQLSGDFLYYLNSQLPLSSQVSRCWLIVKSWGVSPDCLPEHVRCGLRCSVQMSSLKPLATLLQPILSCIGSGPAPGRVWGSSGSLHCRLLWLCQADAVYGTGCPCQNMMVVSFHFVKVLAHVNGCVRPSLPTDVTSGTGQSKTEIEFVVSTLSFPLRRPQVYSLL